ncbi:hypothetical protein [Actinokineospora bangkokensis]|uniref:hypothetical protein n=1 Tax=Actinokineospora bangkokensis TaxID=1193682 RepID=UPI0038B788E5
MSIETEDEFSPCERGWSLGVGGAVGVPAGSPRVSGAGPSADANVVSLAEVLPA